MKGGVISLLIFLVFWGFLLVEMVIIIIDGERIFNFGFDMGILVSYFNIFF